MSGATNDAWTPFSSDFLDTIMECPFPAYFPASPRLIIDKFSKSKTVWNVVRCSSPDEETRKNTERNIKNMTLRKFTTSKIAPKSRGVQKQVFLKGIKLEEVFKRMKQ